MAIAFVARRHSSTDTSSTNPKALALVSGTTAGNLAILVAKGSSGIKSNSATDSRSNTWGDSQAASNTTLARASVLSTQLATALLAADTVTVTFSAGNSAGMAVYEYSGIATSSPVDVVAQANGASGTAPSGGSVSIVTTYAGETLILATLALGTNATITTPSGWTLRDSGQSGNASGCVQTFEKIVSGAGTYTFDPTWASSTAWSIVLVAYKSVSTGSAASGTGSLTLGMSTAAAGASAATGALTLGATAAWTAPTSSGSVALSATATASASAAGTGSLALTGTAATVVTGVTGVVTLTASTAGSGSAAAAGSLSLTATAGTPSITALGVLLLTAAATPAGVVQGTGSIELAGSLTSTAMAGIIGFLSLAAQIAVGDTEHFIGWSGGSAQSVGSTSGTAQPLAAGGSAVLIGSSSGGQQ